MTKEQIENKIAYLRSQRDNPTGNYRRYLVNIYNLYEQYAIKNRTDWAPNFSKYRLSKAAYSGLKPDHMVGDMVERWKDDLINIGYIELRVVDGEERIYLLKDLDF